MNIKTSLSEAEQFVSDHAGKDSFKWLEEQINLPIICFSVYENRDNYSLIYPTDYDGPIEQVVWDLYEGKQLDSINVLKVYNETDKHYYIVENFDFITDTTRCPICHNPMPNYTEHKLIHAILSGKESVPTALPDNRYKHERVMTIPKSTVRSTITQHTILSGEDKQEIHLDNNLINELFNITGVDITYYKYISIFAYDAFIHYHGPIKLPTSRDTKAWTLFMKAFKGGYTQVNQYCVDSNNSTAIYDIDAKSMYPSCMQLYKYPDWNSVEIMYPSDARSYNNFDEIYTAPIDGEYGYLVDFSYIINPEYYDYLDDLPLTVTRNKNNTLESTLQPNRTVDLWITAQWLSKYCESISINYAVKYSQSYVFGDFMQNLLTVRLNHPELSDVIKRCMNSLYGNFLQQNDYSIRQKPALDPLRNEQLADGTYRVLNTKSILQHPKYLSIICLLYSKYRLRQQFYRLKDNLKNVKLIATFVDSIVFTTSSPKQDVDKYVSNESKLGEWCYKTNEPIEKYVCLNTQAHMALTASTTEEDAGRMLTILDNIEKRYKTNKLKNTRIIYINENNELVTKSRT